MPQRPPSLLERLRSAWAHASDGTSSSPTASRARHAETSRGSDFAERLRAAVAARH